jgi:hypothetical protein
MYDIRRVKRARHPVPRPAAPPQAVFLSTASSAAVAVDDPVAAPLRNELEALPEEELERRAKLTGLSSRGGRAAVVSPAAVTGRRACRVYRHMYVYTCMYMCIDMPCMRWSAPFAARADGGPGPNTPCCVEGQLADVGHANAHARRSAAFCCSTDTSTAASLDRSLSPAAHTRRRRRPRPPPLPR